MNQMAPSFSLRKSLEILRLPLMMVRGVGARLIAVETHRCYLSDMDECPGVHYTSPGGKGSSGGGLPERPAVRAAGRLLFGGLRSRRILPSRQAREAHVTPSQVLSS